MAMPETAPHDERRICVIRNPVAGTRHFDMDELLERAGRRFHVEETKGPGDARQLAMDAAAAGFAIVVAAGGDGTVNEVAAGLLGSRSALAILPLGSGNGLARHFGVPLRPQDALATIGRKEIRRMDVGRINGLPFFCTAGIGFDAHVSRHFATNGRRGLRAYTETVLARYWRYVPAEIRLQAGTESFHSSCFLLTFANASEYGNGARIAPDASVFDGELDLCLIDRLPPRRAFRAAWALMHGTFQQQEGIFRRGARFSVAAPEKVEFHIDGDFAGEEDSFEIGVEGQLLAVAM